MMNIDIEVPSSSSDVTYLVSVRQDDDGVLISCTCPAGLFGKLCKHKLEVLNSSISATESDPDETRYAVHRLIGSTDILLFLTEMNRADQALQTAKRVLDAAKKNLEKSLNGGSNRK